MEVRLPYLKVIDLKSNNEKGIGEPSKKITFLAVMSVKGGGGETRRKCKFLLWGGFYFFKLLLVHEENIFNRYSVHRVPYKMFAHMSVKP